MHCHRGETILPAHQKTRVERGLLTLLICLAGFQVLGGCTPQASTPAQAPSTPGPAAIAEESPNSLAEGSSSSARDVALTAIDKAGFDQAIANLKGKVVLVDCWATWCVPCRKSFPHTVALHRQYADKGLAVISLAMDDADAHDEALSFLNTQQANFANYRSQLGAEEAAFAAFEIDGGAVPHYKLYGRDGKLVRKFVSNDPDQSYSQADIDAAVTALLAAP